MKPHTIANHEQSHFIDGSWFKGQGPEFISINPVDGALLWSGRAASLSEIRHAVESAHQALGPWANLGFGDRLQYVERFGKMIEENSDALTQLISQETGKPLWESATEVKSVIAKINISKDAYFDRTRERETQTPDAKGRLRFKPHGVVAVLGPFNFPAHLSNGHIVPALIAGNTVILKPSELTPAVAEFMIECWAKSGLPRGVLNCIQGDGTTAQALINEDIQGVFFTGSYKTGLAINKQLSSRPEIILALEMGGNNPLLIDKVANQPAALYQTAISAFITAGQRCTCARRVLIADNHQGDEFLKLFVKLAQNIKVGPYTQVPEPFMGSVITYEHAVAHLAAQDNLIANGGHPVLKMKLQKNGTGLLSPGIIDMSSTSGVFDEEIFAPLVQIYRYKDFDDALRLANQTQYGLAAGIFTDDAERFKTFYQTVRAGLINWNRPTTGAASNLPFGGIGHSGNHRPSAWFAADYCAYPVSTIEQSELSMPSTTLPGIELP